MPIKTILFGLVAIISTICSSRAESITFQALAIQDPITDVFFKSEGKKNTFSIPAYHLSEPQVYAGGSVLKFYAKDPQDDHENESAKPSKKTEPLAVATLPNNTPRVLIIFSKQDATTYKCMVIPDGPNDFPAGALRFFNGTPGHIAVSYNHVAPFQLGSGEISLIKDQSGNHPIQVAMQTAQGWQRMISGFVNPIPDGRRNIFLMAGSLIRADAAGIPPRPLEMIIVDSAVPAESHP
jgi:hypothetical protein